jgi:hypothetical protein
MAPRDDDKAMDGLLRRSLARHAAPGDTCPEPDILAAYFEQSLDPEEMARYDLHFSQCAQCREQLAAIFRAQSVIEVPVEHELMDVAPTAEAPRAMAMSSIAAEAPEKLGRPGKFDWRWLAPVAAAILVVVFLYGRNVFRLGKSPNSSYQVAMSKPEAVPPVGQPDSQFAMEKPAPAPPTRTEAIAKSAAPAQPAAPPAASELELKSKNSAAVPRPMDREVVRLDALRREYENRNNLQNRPESATGTAMNQTAPAEADTLSAAKKNAEVVSAPSAPAAAPAPVVTLSGNFETRAGAHAAGAPAVSSAPKSAIAGAANSGKQTQSVAGKNAAAGLSAMRQAVAVQPASLVIQTPDADVLYRVAEVGVVERTNDGGASWQGQQVKANAEILAGAAPSENVCWLVGRGGIVLMTNDGKNWKQIPSAASVDLVAVTATDASFATVTAADGRKFSTRNGGLTWQLMN